MSNWTGTATPPSSATTNSYITIAELEAMIGDDPRAAAVALKAATDAAQAWCCQEATRRIDSLPLRGHRYEDKYIENGVQKDSNSDGLAQTLEFPRYIDGVVCDWDAGTQLPIVPEQVLWACLEEAIAILAAWTGSFKDLQEQGVSSMSIGGKLSYSFITGAGQSPLQSAIAKRYMRRYIGAEVR